MVRYDTPTDGISRKMFDRYKDAMERKYGKLRQGELDLQRHHDKLSARIVRLEQHIEELEEELDNLVHRDLHRST